MNPQLQNTKIFMDAFSQPTRLSPTQSIPYAERLLRARLILEEAMETVNALGFEVIDVNQYEEGRHADKERGIPNEVFEHRTGKHGDMAVELIFRDSLSVSLSQILDGVIDGEYVGLGTLHTFGLQDLYTHAQHLVHESNMSKLWTKEQIDKHSTVEHYNYVQVGTNQFFVQHPDGKIIKPPTFKAPNLKGLLNHA